MSEIKECSSCGHKREEYGSLLCVGDLVAKPVESVRHFRGRCGLEGKLWIPMKSPKKGKR